MTKRQRAKLINDLTDKVVHKYNLESSACHVQQMEILMDIASEVVGPVDCGDDIYSDVLKNMELTIGVRRIRE